MMTSFDMSFPALGGLVPARVFVCVMPIVGPAITEDEPHGTVPVQERSDPSLMGAVGLIVNPLMTLNI